MILIKNKTNLFVNILIIPYLAYLFFYDLTDHIGGAALTYGLLLVPVLFIFPTHYLHVKGQFSRSLSRLFIGWLILLVFVLGYNKAFPQGVFFDSFRFAVVVFFTYFLAHFDDWQAFGLRMMTVFGMIHVAATILFYFSNGLFRLLILPLREFPPVGSVQGTAGYHSGLCSHYSLNGTYCAIMALIFGAVWLNLVSREKRMTAGKFIALFGFILSFVALLLSTKRAHLIFVVLSLAFVFYYTNLNSRSNKWFQIVCLLLTGLLIVYLLTFINSPLTATFQRLFENSEDISNGRFEMWILAVLLFLRNPLFGVGWLGYRYEYAANLFRGVGFYSDSAYRSQYVYLDTHNVYLQVLAETGVVGFTAFMVAVAGTLIMTIKIYKMYQQEKKEDSVYLAVSLGLQVFMLLYSLTGCCLNDITFLFYMFGCGFSYSLFRRNIGRRNDDKGREGNKSRNNYVS